MGKTPLSNAAPLGRQPRSNWYRKLEDSEESHDPQKRSEESREESKGTTAWELLLG